MDQSSLRAADAVLAVTLTLVALGDESALSIGLAWGYVGLRVVHSLVQALVDKIELRFLLFAISSLVLLTLSVRAALIVS